MKPSPARDFPIRVGLESDEHQDLPDGLFDGIYRAVLNHTVTIVFVPDVSALAPPWDERSAPSVSEPLATSEQARMVTALTARYVVTPNERLAPGEDTRPSAGVPDIPLPGAVFYVRQAEFEIYAAELAELSQLISDVSTARTVSRLSAYEVVRFLADRVAASTLLDPRDARILGREHPNDTRSDEPLWVPNDEVERALEQAAAADDIQRFFRILDETPLYLPQIHRDPERYDPERDDQDPRAWIPYTTYRHGEFTVPVFSSVATLNSVMTVTRYERTSVRMLLADAVGLHPRIAVNPGTPIEIDVPLNSIMQILSGDLVLRNGELVPPGTEFVPIPASDDTGAGRDPNRDHLILNDPTVLVPHDEYLAALFDSRVFVPTTREARFPDALPELEFPWCVTDTLDAPTIEVFTSEHGLADAHPDRVATPLPFVMLMLAFPNGHALIVNPSGPVRIAWQPEHIEDLRRQVLAD